MAFPRRPEHFVVAARVHQQRRTGVERQLGVFVVGGDGAELAQRSQSWHRHDEVVRELVERPLDAEVRAEREREHEGVGREIAAAVVADEQNRPVGRNPFEAADVGTEIQRRQQPQAGKLLADVVGVALIEVCLGNAGGHLVLRPPDNIAEPRHSGRIDTGHEPETCERKKPDTGVPTYSQ